MTSTSKRCAVLLGVVLVACGGSGAAGDDPVAGGDPTGRESFVNTATPDGGGTSTSRACATDAECGSGGVCNPSTKICACGGSSLAAELVPANLLIVLDRSCSMKQLVGGKSKWSIAVGALQGLLQKNASKIHFGLELFPDTTGGACTQDAIAVPVGDATEAKISKMLGSSLSTSNALFPSGPCVTNIDTGMLGATKEPALSDATRKSFVLLVTDGAQSADCNAAGGDNGTKKVIEDLRARGVDTFVVGFGGEVDKAQLDVFANAGGQARVGATSAFFDAADEASLGLALSTIAKKTLGCTMRLASAPADPSQLFVFLDASPTPLARDTTHAGGWDYDAASQSVTFYGDRCDALKAGTVERASVVVGCAGGAPPENPVK